MRTLVFSTRGVSSRERHLIKDIRALLPHSKKENKLDEKHEYRDHVKELCLASRCDTTVFFENRKRKDLYMWLACAPYGPSVRFQMTNVHTMRELKLAGNCIKGSRPLLHFDKVFETEAHLRPIKALFNRVFGTPRYHALSKPFVDHIFCFFWFDNRIWFRNYQIVDQEISAREVERSLLEIGPRFVLNPIRLFAGCLGGKTVWANPKWVTPSKMRSVRRKKGNNPPRAHQKQQRKDRREQLQLTRGPSSTSVQDVFEMAE